MAFRILYPSSYRTFIFPLLLGVFLFLTIRLTLTDNINTALRNIAGSEKTLNNANLYGEGIYSKAQVIALYKRNNYKPFWIENNMLSPQASELLDAVNYASYEGLQPSIYHLQAIKEIIKSKGNLFNSAGDSLAQTDILLTDAFVTLSMHLYAGSISHNRMNVNRNEHLKNLDLFQTLDSSIKNRTVLKTLLSLSNPSHIYQLLKHNLMLYKFMQANGDFPSLPNDLKLLPGDTSLHIITLCEMLNALNISRLSKTPVFDTVISNALKQFQHNFGLAETGLLTAETINELNVPLGERIRQIELNMERCRWLPRQLADTFVMVNIPGFSMQVFEHKKRKMGMRAIVGTQYKQTPVFDALMTYMVINPYWDVPYSIATKELLPLIKMNPGYLKKNHMLLYRSGDATTAIDPYKVSWKNTSATNFPYRIRQLPGRWNALGEIKFIFPNPYNVYLHGTPNLSLFEKRNRSFSHGCMRLENPVQLAVYLLQKTNQWPEEKIKQTIKAGKETVVKLPVKMPVYVCYFTCWPDANGKLHFRNDVYGHDDLLAKAFYPAKNKTMSFNYH